MTQFIELTDDGGEKFILGLGWINDAIITSPDFRDKENDEYKNCKGEIDKGGYSAMCLESPAEILAKIKEAQANDPLERIAVALENIASELNKKQT